MIIESKINYYSPEPHSAHKQ